MEIGFAVCGSFCTYSIVFPVMEQLSREHHVTPIFSDTAYSVDSRFGTAREHIVMAETICGTPPLRNGRPVLVAVSSNDALAGAAENIGKLLARKHYYFVPFGQDDAVKKPTSRVADFAMIPQAMTEALAGRQIQPILL